jgi:hypothetical protein
MSGAAAARARAEEYRALAEVSSGDTRITYLAMAEWWDNRAAELEAEEKC